MLTVNKNGKQEFDVWYNETPIVNYNELWAINMAIYVVVCSVFFEHYLKPILYPFEQTMYSFHRENSETQIQRIKEYHFINRFL